MATNNNSNRYPSEKGRFFKGKTFILLVGLLLGAGIMVAVYKTSVYFSSDESCMMCHVHPHAEDSWKLSKHVNNGSGVKTHCVACHLPPQSDTWNHYTAKAKLGLKDVWSFMTKDSADFDWNTKSELEHAVKYIPNESCKECHQNLFPEGINQDGITAHLYYDENEKKLDLQCISCHLDAGHYNPDYKHGKLTGIPGAATATVDTSLYFKTATPVTSFTDYTEQIPGTAVAFKMVAIPGGTFKMGSTDKEPFHKADEAPVRNVTISPFFMAEVEVTWDQYWAFYGQTMSEGRTPPETLYANNSNPDVDAISGPTPPFGFPDQGWGAGDLQAITMTHYAAETFCQWLSKQTGKKYRLPTEGELNLLLPMYTEEADRTDIDVKKGLNHPWWNDNTSTNTTYVMVTDKFTETIYLKNGVDNLPDETHPADPEYTLKGQSQLKVGVQTDQIAYPADPGTNVYNIRPVYGLRFKGTSQYAAYRWESCRIADNPLERYFSIKIKALPADSELTVDDVADNASFWRDGFIEFKFPASGYYKSEIDQPTLDNITGLGVNGYCCSSALWVGGLHIRNLNFSLNNANVGRLDVGCHIPLSLIKFSE